MTSNKDMPAMFNLDFKCASKPGDDNINISDGSTFGVYVGINNGEHYCDIVLSDDDALILAKTLLAQLEEKDCE